jgi:glutathione S-transferase
MLQREIEMPDPVLYIANKNYSSWSLRAWLYMKLSGIPFEERRVPLYTPEWDEEVPKVSPSGRLPALHDGPAVVWDSLAIITYLLGKFPGAVGWPQGDGARAEALSVSAEMHSGFMALRQEMPLNCRAKIRGVAFSEEALEDAARIRQIWRSGREGSGAKGPWLFGELSIADVMFAPVALRFRTYDLPMEGPVRAYAEALANAPAVREWVQGAFEEKEVLEQYERKI